MNALTLFCNATSAFTILMLKFELTNSMRKNDVHVGQPDLSLPLACKFICRAVQFSSDSAYIGRRTILTVV